MTQKMTRRSFAALAVGVPGMAALYACTPGEPAPPSPTANVAITQPQTGGAPTATTAPAQGAAASTSFTVSMVDLKFIPPDFTIPPDTDVSVTATNDGVLQHNWTVLNTSFATPTDDPGKVSTITVNLPAGNYPVECTVPGHAAAGMIGTLTVAAAGAAGAAGAPAGGATPASGTPQSATPVGATPESGTPVATTGGTPAAAAGATSITVSMIDLKFVPPDFTIPANTDVSVTATNDGFAEHNWDVLGTNFKTQIAAHGVSETITVNLPTGTYNIQCDVPGHAAAGMVGVLTVA